MKSGVPPDAQGEQEPAGGLAFGDILFTLFRHKFLILGFLILGLGAAVVVRFIKPPNYESTAQIYVPYVVEIPVTDPNDPNTGIKRIGGGGEIEMQTEVDMLKSFDTAVEVAKQIGPERILASYGGGSNELRAAGVIASGISVSPPRTMSLTITFSHRESELVQPVMAAIVKVYMHRHLKMRTGAGEEDIFSERREEARKKLEGIEKQLTMLKTNAGVPDLRERMNAVSKEYATLQSQVLKAQSDLARSKAEVGEFAGMTNLQENAIPPDQISFYSEILGQIEELKKRKRTLILDDLTTNHPSVLKLDVKIDERIRQKISLEQQFPSLTNYVSSSSRAGGAGNTNIVKLDLASAWAEITRLERTIKSDEAVLVGLRDEAFRLMELEPKLTELERRRDAAKKEYEYAMASADKVNLESNSTGGVIQMREMQKPTPPKVDEKKLRKLIAAAFGGCVGLGLGIAFLVDIVLDRSIRRPSQIIRSLRLPVMVTIPDSNRKDSSLFSWGRRNGNMKMMRRDRGDDDDKSSNAVAPWSPDNQLQSHIEGLRERVITYFEVRDVPHSPKLVAVTACLDGAGVTTLASGLAASLSRTGSGSVLLVDMNAGEGVTHSFYKGKPGYGPAESIETDSDVESGDKNLAMTKRAGSQTKGDRLAGMLPPGFNDLKPKLNANAYDYVVFDMTVISPASVTPRFSGHMDLVLFVIESEKTKDHIARHASELMRESRANVLAILNKYHNPVPSWLAHD